MCRFHTQLEWPQRPWGVRMALVGRHRMDLQLVNRRRPLAVCGSEAVRAGVSAAENDDALAGSRNLFLAIKPVTRTAFVLLGEVIHRKMNSLQIATRDREIAMLLSAH